jgi:hypothetical protein
MNEAAIGDSPELTGTALLLAKMLDYGFAEMHRLATLFQKAEVTAIRVTGDSVVVCFAEMEKAIEISSDRREHFRVLFGEMTLTRSASFWKVLEEALAYYETEHGKAAINLWEEWCREMNPFVLQAIPEGKEVA